MKKLFLAFVLLFSFAASVSAIVAPSASADTKKTDSVIDSELTGSGGLYKNDGAQKENIEKVNAPFKLAVQILGGIGGTCFVLAVMYYAVMIIFGQLNPQKSALYWKALLGCAAGAFIFFGAASFADVIAQLAITN